MVKKLFLLGLAIVGLFFIARNRPTPAPAPAVVSPKASSPSAQPVTSATASAIKSKEEFPAASPQPQTGFRVPILMYHYVGNNPNPSDRQRDILSITPDKFDAQMKWLSTAGYHPITLDTLYGLFAKKEIVSKPIVLTFDDGYIDFYTTAAPILRQYSFPAVAFIPTGLVGGGYYMNWGQIKELTATGLVSFQAHTVHHYNLPSLSYTQQLLELRDSKKTLEAQTGTIVNFIAYPYGASNPTVWRAALEAGFVGGTGTWFGRAAGPGINMPRIRINGNSSLGDFISRLSN